MANTWQYFCPAPSSLEPVSRAVTLLSFCTCSLLRVQHRPVTPHKESWSLPTPTEGHSGTTLFRSNKGGFGSAHGNQEVSCLQLSRELSAPGTDLLVLSVPAVLWQLDHAGLNVGTGTVEPSFFALLPLTSHQSPSGQILWR